MCFVKVDDVAIMPVVDAAPNVDTLGMNIVWGTQGEPKGNPRCKTPRTNGRLQQCFAKIVFVLLMSFIKVAKWPGGGVMGFCFTCTMDEMILFHSCTNNVPF